MTDFTQRDERWQIRVVDLRKRFRPDLPEALRGVTVDFERGKVNVVIGGSGQGKSVLLKHIIGLLKPTSARQIFVQHARKPRGFMIVD